MASLTSKDSLIAELANTRTRMTGLGRALRYDLQIVPRLRANIARNQLAWFAGAAVVGLIFSQLLARPKRVVVHARSRTSDATAQAGKAAFALTVLKFALDFAKPVILRYIASRFRGSPAREVR